VETSGDEVSGACGEPLGMKVTAFVDVLSHWCLAAQPAIDALRATLADDVELEIVHAPLGDGAPAGVTHEAEAWFYTRGTLAYGRELDPGWCEGLQTTTWHANAAVAAGISFGANPIVLGRRVSRAAMVDGLMLGREAEAIRAVAKFTGVDDQALRDAMHSAKIIDQLHAGNARLAEIGCAERPSWELVNANGDRAVLQGVWQAEAILPLARGLLDDERTYRRAGPPPR
jgi:predicted DsbA family dithiol-disulfide isomerase